MLYLVNEGFLPWLISIRMKPAEMGARLHAFYNNIKIYLLGREFHRLYTKYGQFSLISPRSDLHRFHQG
jgi:hypothetical protein